MSPSGADPTAPSGQPDPQTSAQWDPDREPVEELAGEFVERRRRGERTTIEEYAQRYPNLAGEIRDLFPAVLAMEKLNHRAQDDLRPSHQNISVEQLGDFRVISEIARGGMGIVYEAEQVTLGRRVAVKVLPQMALRNERDVLRFHREARTSAKLHHTNIVPVFGVGEQDGLYYIVMQFIQGVGLDEIRSELRRLVLGGDESTEQPSTDRARSSYVKRNAAALLSEKMRRESSSDSGRELVDSTSRFAGTIDTDTTDGEPATDLDRGQDDEGDANEYLVRIDSEYWRNVARIGVQAASALHYAHAHGTLHRDVKPGNLLLDGEGVVWVADFGLAKAVEQDDVTWTGDIVGTLGYMAPERFHGDCDERSDLYGLGLTLYELLTFERAYEGPDRVALMHRVAHGELPLPRRQNPAIPRDLETIIMKAAAKNPDERYQSAADLAADLQNFLDDRPIRARRVHPLEQAIRWCRRNRAVASLATTVALLLALISLVASWGYVRESRQRYRAEATSQLAVDALERIYGQFAPNQLPLRVPEAPAEGDEDAESLLDVQTQLPLSRNVAELLDNLLEFYDQLSKQTEDQGVLLKSIMANRRVADIQFRLGQHEPARTSYERAIERAKSIDAVTEPITLELARIHNGLGTVLLAQRDRDSASESHHQALELLEPHGASLDAKYEIARTLFLLHQSKRRFWWFRRDGGNSDEKQDREENKQIIQRAVALLIELSGEHAEVPEYRFLLAKCYRAETARPVETAGSTSAKAVALLEELVRQRPDVADYRFELGDAYMESGFRRLRPGDETSTPEELAAAESRLRRALEVTSDIELTHPNIPQYLHQKTRLHHTLARILESQNQPEAASQQYGEAIQRQAWAVRRDPDDYHPRVWLAHLRLEWAQLLIDTQQTEVACEQLKMIPQILGDPETQQTDSRFVTRMAERVRTRTDEILDDIRTRRRGG